MKTLLPTDKIHVMFYKELYNELGKLFYTIANADGKISKSERETLQMTIQKNWKPLEKSKDKFGTDLANVIDFSFEFEESMPEHDMSLQSFASFYKDNKRLFTPLIISNILHTAKSITKAERGENSKEKAILEKLAHVLEK